MQYFETEVYILALVWSSMQMEKTAIAFSSLYTSNVLTFKIKFYLLFSHLHWNFQFHKHLTVTHIITRDGYKK